MAGRPHTRERQRLEEIRVTNATTLASEPRQAPTPYSPELAPEMMALAASGLNHVEIAAHWCISEETFREWVEGHSEFAATVRCAQTRAKACWLKWIREATATGDNKFAAGAWSHYMRANYPEYEDKHSINIQVNLVEKLVRLTLLTPELLGEQRLAGAKPLNEQASVGLDASPTASDDPANGPVIEGQARRVEPG